MAIIRCSVCLKTYEENAFSVAYCPECHTKILPYLEGNDITITLNVHELQAMTMWAARFVDQIVRESPSSKDTADCMLALENTINKIRAVKPDISWTMGDEMKRLRKDFKDFKFFDSKGNEQEPLL